MTDKEQRERLDRIANLAHWISYHHNTLIALPRRAEETPEYERAVKALEVRVKAMAEELKNG